MFQIGSYLEDLCKTPGPGRYNATHPNTNKNMAPLYSMRSRSYPPGDTTKKPGPGAHTPEKVVISRPQAPKYSLGIRHSEFICPFVSEGQTYPSSSGPELWIQTLKFLFYFILLSTSKRNVLKNLFIKLKLCRSLCDMFC